MPRQNYRMAVKAKREEGEREMDDRVVIPFVNASKEG